MMYPLHGILYFKNEKRNTSKFVQLLRQHVKGNGLLLNSCSLIPAKWKKPHAQPSGSGLFLRAEMRTGAYLYKFIPMYALLY